ncbi:hypothetical protein L484_027563 [Morus notabilis]|uniref:Uncharacterized protein n=1 Tax=Morus notabilis TaxID=981085 RepID=W9S8Z6_9ROSA|nr:hypothetical protein L484_027563 [Morus notabilis]
MGGGGLWEDHGKMEGTLATNTPATKGEWNHRLLEKLSTMQINTPWECDYPADEHAKNNGTSLKQPTSKTS